VGAAELSLVLPSDTNAHPGPDRCAETAPSYGDVQGDVHETSGSEGKLSTTLRTVLTHTAFLSQVDASAQDRPLSRPLDRHYKDGTLNRYSPDEMVRYWKSHYAARGNVDWRTDPDGLNNVCQSGAPFPVNRYYHRSQRRAYLHLLGRLLPFAPGQRALDIGCGGGRWSRLLTGSGLAVTGIDLQDDMIAANRSRNAGIRFEVCPIQDFRSAEPFDLLSSVTVIQHLPAEEQVRAVSKMARLCRPGGHALVLENVGDYSSPHVFPRSPDGWVRLFEAHGFSRAATCSYDYSPVQRLYYAATRRQRLALARLGGDRLPDPESLAVPTMDARERCLRKMDHVARLAACAIDTIVEPALIS